MDPEKKTEQDPTQTIDDDAPEVDQDEILGAIDQELEFIAPEDPPADPEGDPEPAAEAEGEDDPKDKVDEGEPAGEPEPEVKDDDGAEKGEGEAEPEPLAAKDDTPKDAADAKPSDEFGNLDKDTPQKTRERFETVKGKYDELVTERDNLQAEVAGVRAESEKWANTIRDTGTNQEQFGMVIDYLGKVNSNDPKELNTAYDIMLGELTVLGQALGRPVPGAYDPLVDNADLQARVDDGTLGEADAQEIAQARANSKLTDAQSEIRTEQNKETQAKTDALEEVKQLGAKLQASDPMFQAKMPFLAPMISSLEESGVHPSKWASAVFKMYSELPEVPAPAKTEPKPDVPAAPNALRPTGASPATSALDKEPGSMVEAIDVALERGY